VRPRAQQRTSGGDPPCGRNGAARAPRGRWRRSAGRGRRGRGGQLVPLVLQEPGSDVDLHGHPHGEQFTCVYKGLSYCIQRCHTVHSIVMRCTVLLNVQSAVLLQGIQRTSLLGQQWSRSPLTWSKQAATEELLAARAEVREGFGGSLRWVHPGHSAGAGPRSRGSEGGAAGAGREEAEWGLRSCTVLYCTGHDVVCSTVLYSTVHYST